MSSLKTERKGEDGNEQRPFLQLGNKLFQPRLQQLARAVRHYLGQTHGAKLAHASEGAVGLETEGETRGVGAQKETRSVTIWNRAVSAHQKLCRSQPAATSSTAGRLHKSLCREEEGGMMGTLSVTVIPSISAASVSSADCLIGRCFSSVITEDEGTPPWLTPKHWKTQRERRLPLSAVSKEKREKSEITLHNQGGYKRASFAGQVIIAVLFRVGLK